jgi:hypothetical protein
LLTTTHPAGGKVLAAASANPNNDTNPKSTTELNCEIIFSFYAVGNLCIARTASIEGFITQTLRFGRFPAPNG